MRVLIKNIMKRLFLLLALAGFVAGCSKSDDGGSGSDDIILSEQEMKINTDGGSTVVRFTTNYSWSAEVVFDDDADEKWLTVSPTSGDAGLVRMRVTLSPNTGKEARSARIVITSDNEHQSIEITQAGTDTPTDGGYEDISGGDPGDDDGDDDDNSYAGDLSGDMPDNEIWYLSTNGEKAVCNYDCFGVQILSETYSGGKGVIKLSGPAKIIDRCAFESNLRSIRIPESVTKIGESAFFNCLNLKEITIPNSVTYMGKGAFSTCYALTKVKISENITTIDESVFYGCENLKEITIPGSVTSIGNSAFSYCISLESITIPQSVGHLGSNAFYACTNLKSITLSESLTTIEISMFSGCTGLTSIKIPSSVKSIGSSAFSDCTSLKNVVIPEGVETIGRDAFEGCTGLTSVKIPSSVESIEYSTFFRCTSLSDVVISEGVETIGGNAFKGCTGLTSINIPSSIKLIDYSAFSDCTNLNTVYVRNTTPPSLYRDTFSNTASTLSIYVPRASVDAYKNASGWSNYKDRIFSYDF